MREPQCVELNVPITSASLQPSGQAGLKSLLNELRRIGYDAAVLNYTISPLQGKGGQAGARARGAAHAGGSLSPAHDLCARWATAEDDAAPGTWGCASIFGLRLLTRLTVELSDRCVGSSGDGGGGGGGGGGGSGGGNAGSGTPLHTLAASVCAAPLSSFDVVAVRPLCKAAMTWLTSRPRVLDATDVLSLPADGCERAPFTLHAASSSAWLRTLLSHGVSVELGVGHALIDGSARRHLVTNGCALAQIARRGTGGGSSRARRNRASRGSLILCGAAREAMQVRAMRDLAVVAQLFGLARECARDVVGANVISTLRRARRKRTGGVELLADKPLLASLQASGGKNTVAKGDGKRAAQAAPESESEGREPKRKKKKKGKR